MEISPFETEEALKLNEARGNFCRSFLPELIREARVTTALDVGCGALGFFSRILKGLGLEVTAFDGRPENLAEASRRNPDIQVEVHNVENPGILGFGSYDLVLCFGLLYHLENPFLAIRNLYSLTKKYLLIEAQIAPHQSLISLLCEESHATNQSLNYVAVLPTEISFVKMLYRAGFSAVFRARRLPDHREFRGSLTRRRMRTILLASKCSKPEWIEKWGAAEFCLVPEPELPAISPETWNTALGKLVHGVTDPRAAALWILDGLIKFAPSSIALKVCGAMARPRQLRLWPGWVLGAGQSGVRPLKIARRILWRWFSLKCVGHTFVLRWDEGIKVLIYPKNETCRALFITGYYEPNELCFLKKVLRPGMVFIDVGANMGLYSLFASKLVGAKGTVLAVEPSGREFQRLKANIELNQGANIRAIQVGISNDCSERELLIGEEEHSGHNTLGAFAYAGVRAIGRQRVRTERLDELVKREGLSRVDVVKIDVEGHELRVLEGAKDTIRQFHPILLVEIADQALLYQECTSSQVLDFLRQCGYRLYLFSRQSGLPEPLDEKIKYFDSQNLLAVHESGDVKVDGTL